MRNINSLNLIFLLFAALLYISAFTVDEGQVAVMDSIISKQSYLLKPGLHWHVPFFDKVSFIDMRLQNWQAAVPDLNTQDQQGVSLHYFANWQVIDAKAYQRYRAKIPAGMPQQAKQFINRYLQQQAAQLSLTALLAGQSQIFSTEMFKQVNQLIKPFGMMVSSIGITSIQLSGTAKTAILSHMQLGLSQAVITERAQGDAKVTATRSAADAQAAAELAAAKIQAEQIRGEGEAKAVQIGEDAYQKSPQFYLYFHSLMAYKRIFSQQNANNYFVLRPNDFLMQQVQGVTSLNNAGNKNN